MREDVEMREDVACSTQKRGRCQQHHLGFPLVIAVFERDMPGIEPGSLGWHTSALTTGLQEVRQ